MTTGESEKERLVYSVREFAEAMHCSVALAYQLIRENKIFAVRIGKRRLVIPRKSVLALLEEKKSC